MKIYKLLLLVIIISNINATVYQYQLGIFKKNPYTNSKLKNLNLNELEIIKKNNLYILKTLKYNSLNELKKLKKNYIKIFPDMYLLKNSEDITFIRKKIIKNHQTFIKKLEKLTPASGFYIVGNNEYQLNNSNNLNNSIKIEWRLFNNGYNESVKNLRKKKNESIIQYYQLLIDMKNREKDEFLYKINITKNYLKYNYYSLLKKYYLLLLNKRTELLNNGYYTIDNIQELKTKLDIIEENIKLYKNYNNNYIDEILNYMNKLKSINLIDKDKILKNIYKNNKSILIQDNFKRRSNFYKEWKDDLKINFYLEHKNTNFENSNNVIGIHFEIPVEFNKETKELIKLEKNNYEYQKEAVKIRLKEKLDSLYNQFCFKKSKINILNKELELLKNKLKLNNYKDKYYINELKENPKRVKELLKIQILEKEQEIKETKLELLEKLGLIFYMSEYTNINNILKYNR